MQGITRRVFVKEEEYNMSRVHNEVLQCPKGAELIYVEPFMLDEDKNKGLVLYIQWTDE